MCGGQMVHFMVLYYFAVTVMHYKCRWAISVCDAIEDTSMVMHHLVCNNLCSASHGTKVIIP